MTPACRERLAGAVTAVLAAAALAFLRPAPVAAPAPAPAVPIRFTRPPPVAPEPAAVKLETVLQEVQFDKTPLSEALAWIGQQVGVTIAIRGLGLGERAINPRAPITFRASGVKASRVLECVLLAATFRGITPTYWCVGDFVVVRSHPLPPRWITMTVCAYDVRDLVEAGMAARGRARAQAAATRPAAAARMATAAADARQVQREIAELIVQAVNNHDDADDSLRINGAPGVLVITAIPEYHRRTAEFLSRLRSATGCSPDGRRDFPLGIERNRRLTENDF